MAERIEGVNRKRVEWCCDEEHLSVEDLFDLLGLSEKALNAFLADEPALTFGQLEKIAKHFSRGVLFFLEDTPPDPQRVYTPQFRTITNQKPELSPKVRALIERAERHREIFISVQEELGEDHWKPWKQRLPKATQQGSMQDRAMAVRKWLDLDGVKKWEDYRARVEDQGVLVFVSNGYNGPWQIPKESAVRGFSLVHKHHPLILIKKQAFESPMLFTMFHELAHLILHDESFVDEEEDLYSYQGKEAEANKLTGLILLPDHLLAHVDVDEIRLDEPEHINDDLSDYRKRWGISSEVILRRLLDTKQISKKQYEGFRAWCKANPPILASGGGARHRFSEPLRMFGRSYVGMVLEAVSMDRVTLNKASSYLDNIKVSDLHKLEARCVSA